MSKNVSHLQHVKSSVVESGKPKLPTAGVLAEGEIAVNYADGYETLSIKSSSGNIKTFSSDEYYTEQKLGSGFTGENSARTVTDVIEENELVIASSLNDLNGRKLDASAYTPTDLSNYYTKSETSGATELEVAFSGKTDIGDFVNLSELVGSGFTSSSITDVIIDDEEILFETLGISDVPQFDPTESYSLGDFVMYDKKLYKFIVKHNAGAWNPFDVVQTNLIKEVDDMAKLDYEEVIISLVTESGAVLSDMEVVVTVEGEQSERNLTTDAQGKCTTNVNRGLEYTVEAAAPQGYLPCSPIIRRASLPTRNITFTFVEEPQSDYEHLVVNLVYMDSSLGVADHVVVSYSGDSYSIPVVNNVAETDIPLGVTYTVSFQSVDGYKTPHDRSHLAKFAGQNYTMKIYYVAAIAGTRWLMNDGTEKDFNGLTTDDKNDVFGLIVNTGDLAQASCGFVIPLDVMFNGGGSGNWFSANEEINTLGFFTSHASALTDLDGEQNCEKIREYIASQAELGITRSSAIAQTVYNRCGGVGVKAFATNVPYTTGDIVSYQNKLYEFIVDHPSGNWNASQVVEYGIGYVMPDASIQRCFTPSYGQIYSYRLLITNVQAIAAEIFEKSVLNVASGYWWTSTQYSATSGVFLNNGGFYNASKTYNGYTLLPVLAY